MDGIGLDLRKAHIRLKTRIDEIHIMGIPIRRVALNGTLEKHKLRNLLSSIKLFKSGPFYKPGKMNKKSDFGLGWEKS